MKLAIISLTTNGHKLAEKIAHKLEDDHTFLTIDIYHKNVKITLEKIINQYDCILGIMASGIMIRSVCHLLKNKTQDPAILVMDELGKHIINLLSGHIGGGNYYTLKIAEFIGADPVITTATDVIGKIGIDTLAYKFYLEIDDPSKIRIINQALVEGEEVNLALPPNYEFIYDDELVKKSYSKTSSSSEIKASFNGTVIKLMPLNLVVGLGARKCVSKYDVLTAIEDVFNILKLPLERIDSLTTAEPKKNEKGICEVASDLQLPLRIVSLEDLEKFKNSQCSESSLVMKVFGVLGVSEPTAILSAGKNAKLIFRKKAVNNVTVAVAVANLVK